MIAGMRAVFLAIGLLGALGLRAPGHAEDGVDAAGELAPLEAGLVVEVVTRTSTLVPFRAGSSAQRLEEHSGTWRLTLEELWGNRIDRIAVVWRKGRRLGLVAGTRQKIRTRSSAPITYVLSRDAVATDQASAAATTRALLDGLPMRATIGARRFEVGTVTALDAAAVRDLLGAAALVELGWLGDHVDRAELTLRGAADGVGTFDLALDLSRPGLLYATAVITYDLDRDLPLSLALTGRGPDLDVALDLSFAYPAP